MYIITDKRDPSKAVAIDASNHLKRFGFWVDREAAYRFETEADARSALSWRREYLDHGQVTPAGDETMTHAEKMQQKHAEHWGRVAPELLDQEMLLEVVGTLVHAAPISAEAIIGHIKALEMARK